MQTEIDRNIRTSMDDELDLFAYLDVVIRRKRVIVAITACAFIISIVASLLLPKKYESTVSVMPPKPEDTIGLGLASATSSGLGGLASGVLGITSPSDLWVGVLQSRNVTDAVIERFALRERYATDTIEDTRKKLDSAVTVQKTDEEIIKVSVLDKDPEMAARIANAFVDELDRVNRSSVMTSGARTRVFLEKRLDEAKLELSKVEEAIRAFQEKNKAIKLDDQSKAIIDAVGSVKGQLMAKEVELETILDYATATHPRVQILKAEVTGLNEKLRELEAGGSGASGINDIFIPTDRIPGLSFQFIRLMRDAKVQETLVEFLTQQYEIARIQEAKDSPTVQVLDIAKAAEKKVRPRRAIIVLLGTSAAFFLSLFMIFFLEYLKRPKERA